MDLVAPNLLVNNQLNSSSNSTHHCGIGYEEALWPKKLEIGRASQILTYNRQILVLS